MSDAPHAPKLWAQRWAALRSSSVRGFHAYAGWLVSISWKRFFLLSLVLLVGMAILKEVPPFRWSYTETVSEPGSHGPAPPTPPKTGRPEKSSPGVRIEKGKGDGIEISIDEQGVRIRKAPGVAASTPPAVPAAPIAPSDTSPPSPPSEASSSAGGSASVEIRLPPGMASEAVKEAVAQARREIEDAMREQAASDAAEADAADAEPLTKGGRSVRKRTRTVSYGDALPELALLWILASAVIKITYKHQIQAEAQAARAVETAEAESLKRQVVEARMAAMQAQVEPHFLFNTLASIDHLIEVDPRRASQMQKNLIALLRASMPTMREAGDGAARDLGRELSVIRPYLEILKVRMEERLSTSIEVPDGLLSAEFPSMMMQTLVENAIKHGLEPKPEGGQLRVKAEVVHGKLALSVIDTGLGFGRAATAGTGVGLANVRERLALLYGGKAALTLTENPGGGTIATITIPYKPLQGDAA